MSATSRRWVAVKPSRSSLESLDSLFIGFAISGCRVARLGTAQIDFRSLYTRFYSSLRSNFESAKP